MHTTCYYCAGDAAHCASFGLGHCPDDTTPATPVTYLYGTYMPTCVAQYVAAGLLDWAAPAQAQDWDWADWSY